MYCYLFLLDRPNYGPTLSLRAYRGRAQDSEVMVFRQSWTKVLGHICVSGAFSNSHRSNPSPHPTNNVGRVHSEFFRDSTLYRMGGGRTAREFRKGCTVLREDREMTEKYEYCRTVPRTFVQDCRLYMILRVNVVLKRTVVDSD